MTDTAQNNKRIAKNTLLLYVRTFFVMLVSLYTSRVVLNVLGVEDYGIYNVVGGVVAMFSMISGSLSGSISRFITFELGRGNMEKLKLVFTTSVNIQMGLALLILILGTFVGGWFLNYHMNIPEERMFAANWVLQCSLLMFCVNLISIPYNACIVAHEHMTAFAYVGILEAVLKLVVCYLIAVSRYDKLISYAVLLLMVSIFIRIVYGVYCKRHFEECRYRRTKDISLVKEMSGFAGWTFFTNVCYLFNTQGVNILINLFFGVTLNAARGIATQVENAVMQFVNSFMMAVNPQITKSYAAGHTDDMFRLVCRGAKFSYFLMMLLALPVMLEAEYILSLWLKTVPEHSVTFLRLTIIGAMVNMLGNTGYMACMATGHIRRYVLWLSTIGCLVFPLTWLCFKLGMPAESTYVVFILVYIGVDSVRLYIMRGLLGFPVMMFVRDVLWKIVIVTAVSVVLPLLTHELLDESFLRLLAVTSVSIIVSCSCIYGIGLSTREREVVRLKTMAFYHKYIGKS